MRSTLWLPIALMVVVVIIIGGIILLPTPNQSEYNNAGISDLENPELISENSNTNQTESPQQQNGAKQLNQSGSIAEETIVEGTALADPETNANDSIALGAGNNIDDLESGEDNNSEVLSKIQGKVQNSQGDPISQAHIQVDNQEPILSSSEGSFLIEDLNQDQVTVQVQKEGYQPLTQTVAKGALNVVLVLVKHGALAGQVVDQKNDPVAFADVEIQAVRGIWAKNFKTDRDGRFEVESAPEMTLALKASLQGFDETPESTKEVESPSASVVTLVLNRPTFHIAGRVIDRETKSAVSNFQLHLKPDNSNSVDEQTTQTDGTGSYKFDNLSRGTYLISSMSEENSARNLVVPIDDDFKTVRIYENSANNINFEVVQGREITGMVTTNSGQPIANAEVSVSKIGIPKTMTQSDGFYRLSGVPVRSPAGTESRSEFQIQLLASHPQHGNGLSEPLTSNQAAQVHNVNITLKGLSTLRGRVVDESDNPVANAQVSLTNLLSNERFSSMTDGSGNFVFEQVSVADQPSLLEGSHLIQADKEMMGQVSKQIVMQPGEEKFVTLTMQGGGPIRGFVSDAQGTPMPGTLVKTWLPTGGNVTAYTDENGFFELNSLPHGEYDLSFRFDSQPALSAHLYRIQANSSNANAVLLPDEWIITGTVSDNETGQPIQLYDFHLEANPSDPNARPYSLSRSVNTPDGTYQVTVSEPGRFLLTFYADGYNPMQGSVRISPTYRDRQFLNLKMMPTEQYGGITGTLVPPQGTHLVAVGVSGIDIFPTNGNNFSITDIPAGNNYLYFYVSEEPGGVGNQLAGALQVTIRPDQLTNLGTFDAQRLRATRY